MVPMVLQWYQRQYKTPVVYSKNLIHHSHFCVARAVEIPADMLRGSRMDLKTRISIGFVRKVERKNEKIKSALKSDVFVVFIEIQVGGSRGRSPN